MVDVAVLPLLLIATIVTPDTILRWHRLLVARKWTYAKGRAGRRGVITAIRRLVVRMAEENPTWANRHFIQASIGLLDSTGSQHLRNAKKISWVPADRCRPKPAVPHWKPTDLYEPV